MKVNPDYRLIEEMKNQLQKMRDIELTIHAKDKLKEHPIDEEQLKEMLRKPENLTYVEQQKDDKGEKYKFIFRKSGKYDIIIIAVFVNDILRVITTYYQNKKRTKIVEKWRRRKLQR